jgi:lysophospholipase L1-like esterase
MKKVLLTLGDSWPEGAELNGGQRYGQLLQTALAYDEFYNYGSAGASNEDMLYQLQRYMAESYQQDHEVTAIFFLTNPARTAHFPRLFSWESPIENKLKQVYVHFHREEHEVMRSSATVSALQAWCKNLGFDDYYFAGWVRYPVWLPGVDLDKIWAQGNETAADWFGATRHNGEHLLDVTDNIYIRPNFAHPNQLGHQLIADKLAAWITRAR